MTNKKMDRGTSAIYQEDDIGNRLAITVRRNLEVKWERVCGWRGWDAGGW